MTEYTELRELLFRLCSAAGPSGEEDAAAAVVRQELEQCIPGMEVSRDLMGNVVAHMGNPKATRQILLDAHLDQIGIVVTGIDEKGFLQMAPSGGVDRRVLPGSTVTVHGKETRTGIVCCLPPHLVEGGADKVEPVDKMYVDLGMEKEKVETLVSPGDRMTIDGSPRALLGSRMTSAALDDRAGVASIIRCAQLLKGSTLDCGVTLLFSGREETGGEGATTAAYRIFPTEAIMVDVSFAEQPGVSPTNRGKLGKGPMIGMSPSLDKGMTQTLLSLAKEKKIPFQREIMGGKTGTNADSIGIAREGVRTALLSVPQRYMHTPAELVDLADIEHIAQLMAAYILQKKEGA